MPKLRQAGGVFAGVFISLVLFCSPAWPQSRPQTRNRISGRIDDGITVRRAGNRHPLARHEFDRGPASPDLRLERLVLVFQPGADQQKALDELVEAQHDPESPEYQRWLTPEEFGERFGISDDDLDQVISWLQQQGFQVEPPSPSKRFLVFSGSAGQIATTFHTDMREYDIAGERHVANATDPEIPLALANVVGGVASLHDFHSRPMHMPIQNSAASIPNWTGGSGIHLLTPSDFAAIYNLAPLYSASTNGTGQSIAVIGRTNINIADVQNFRRMFGLPSNDPTVVVNGANPGIVSQDELGEAMLDVEWSGAVASKANIQFVISASTRMSDGVSLAAQYAVNKNIAPVITVSFGLCEAAMGNAGNQFWNSLWQQAAAQGITVLVSSGDSGAAGCDSATSSAATQGPAVNAICSSPYSTCVGGTQFNDTDNSAQYWTSNNSASYGSAVGYIPESVWNESGGVSGGSGLWSTGGGHSSIYPKPSWQTGTGVPADGARDVPDVSLTAAGHDAYLVVMSGSTYSVSGTSAAAPSLAGIMALAVQRTGNRLGNVNPALYSLAAKQAASGAAVFHDITTGTNSVPGAKGTPAGAGYDPATGLGSVDAAQLVDHWNDASGPVSTFQLGAISTPVVVTQGKSTTVTVQLTASGSFPAAVALSATGLTSGITASFAPSSIAAGSGSSTLTFTVTTAATAGTHAVQVVATGGGITRTTTVTVSVLPAVCTLSANPSAINPAAGGGRFSITVSIQAGCTWQASSGQSWIIISSGASGNGAGTVALSVAANTDASVRSSSITIAGRSIAVNQAAAVLSFTLSPASVKIGATATTGTLSVTVNSKMASWRVASETNWLTVTSSASGSGNGTVSFATAANPSSVARTGTISVAGLKFTVTQSGVVCSYALGKISVTAKPPLTVLTVPVTSQDGCRWTAASSASWLTIASGASGTGNGTVTLNESANKTNSSRTATVTIAGIGLTVTQSPGN